MKLCIHCKHYICLVGPSWEVHTCRRAATPSITDLVTGESRYEDDKECYQERQGECGEEGKYWVKKTPGL